MLTACCGPSHVKLEDDVVLDVEVVLHLEVVLVDAIEF